MFNQKALLKRLLSTFRHRMSRHGIRDAKAVSLHFEVSQITFDNGIPLPDTSIDVVLSSSVLEHPRRGLGDICQRTGLASDVRSDIQNGRLQAAGVALLSGHDEASVVGVNAGRCVHRLYRYEVNVLKKHASPMHVAVLQSAYVPWRGYFDIIASVDLFVIYDDVQYSKGSWRNRNKIKTQDGSKWLTVPVNVSLGQSIADVTIAYGAQDWVEKHRGLLSQGLSGTHHYEEAIAPWAKTVAERPERLTDLNLRLLRRYCAQLGIETPFASAADYRLEGRGTDRLLTLLKAVGATSYLSGPAAEAYLDFESFRAAGIDLYFKTYDYAPYPQPFGDFQADVSILDLIANLGSQASDRLRSRSGDRKMTL